MKRILLTALCAGLISSTAIADTVRVGIILPQTGVGAILAKHMQAAAELAVSHLGGKIGDQPIEIFWGDSQGKVDVAKQLSDEMIKSKKADFIVGPLFTAEQLGMVGPATREGVFVISPIAGPAALAGAKCNKNWFNTSSQNDQQAEAMGKYLQEAGIKKLYLMTPNYQAGKDMMNGIKRYYKGEIVGEDYTRFGQVDFAAELSALRTKAPEATFIFYPGDMGVQYVKQYAQAGLIKSIPLYTVWTVDQASMPAIGDAAIGVKSANVWSVDLDNPVNKRFVGDFSKKNGYLPNDYAAHTYDAIMLLDGAVREVKGKLNNKDAIRAALEKANFKSNRGEFKFNTNHFPIEDYYLREVVKGNDGVLVTKTVKKVMSMQKDAYYQECKM